VRKKRKLKQFKKSEFNLNKVKRLISQRTGSEKQWIESENKHNSNENSSLSPAKDYQEPEIYLDSHTRTLKISQNNTYMLQRSHSKDHNQNMKKSSFTNQIKGVDKSNSYVDN